MPRRAGGRFQRGPRRSTDWSASAALTAAVVVPAGAAILLEAFVPIVGGETIIRTRGFLGWKSDQVAASED